MSDPRAVAERYFAAISARDVEAAVACWRPGGREVVRGQAVDATAPDGVREFLRGMVEALPDARLEVVQTTTEGDRCAVQWRAVGTFAGAPLDGVEPTGARVELEGVDVLTVRDGLIDRNDAFVDSMGMARQLGLLPAKGSRQEARMAQAFNLRTRLTSKLAASPVEQVAEDVWVVRGGFPSRTMNVFLVREADGSGVFAFDAGIRQMTHAVAAAAASLGGLTRVVLGHGHPDHRGCAPGLGVDVLCHELERDHAEGDGGMRDVQWDKLKPHARFLFGKLLPYWDGGPVKIASTFTEGAEFGDGFRAVHVPGHSPGMVALFRERDRLALTSDAFYLLDAETSRPAPAQIPHPAFTPDPDAARASLRKLAALEPQAAWPGHVGPLTGDVAGQLLRAAEA